MQKVILTLVVFVVTILFVANSSAYSQSLCSSDVEIDPNAPKAPAPRLRIEVLRFPNNDQTVKVITDYYRAKFGNDFQIVLTNPDCILEIENTKVGQVSSWRHIDKSTVIKNNLYTTGQRGVNAVGSRVRTNNPLAQLLRDVIVLGVNSQLESRKRLETSNMEKWNAAVKKRFKDAKTREVIKSCYAENAIVVQKYRPYDGRPMVTLSEGDLSSVIDVSQDTNLGENMQQLLSLSAFMKSDLPENCVNYDNGTN